MELYFFKGNEEHFFRSSGFTIEIYPQIFLWFSTIITAIITTIITI